MPEARNPEVEGFIYVMTSYVIQYVFTFCVISTLYNLFDRMVHKYTVFPRHARFVMSS